MHASTSLMRPWEPLHLHGLPPWIREGAGQLGEAGLPSEGEPGYVPPEELAIWSAQARISAAALDACPQKQDEILEITERFVDNAYAQPDAPMVTLAPAFTMFQSEIAAVCPQAFIPVGPPGETTPGTIPGIPGPIGSAPGGAPPIGFPFPSGPTDIPPIPMPGTIPTGGPPAPVGAAAPGEEPAFWTPGKIALAAGGGALALGLIVYLSTRRKRRRR